MSSQDIEAAQNCSSIECPIDAGFTSPIGCTIPYDGTPDDFCLSTQIGNISTLVVIIVLIAYMTGVGASMEIEKIKHAMKHPKAPLIGLFVQTVLNPLMMFGVIAIFGDAFPLAVKLMAILIASSPGGNGSALLTLYSYGSIELSVVMTIFSTLCSFATLPFWIWFATEVVYKDESEGLSIDFTAIVLSAAMATILPLIGAGIRYKVSEKVGLFLAKYGTLLGIFGVAVIACLYFADPLFRYGLEDLGWELWICTFILNAGGMALGYFASVLCRLPHRFHRTIAFEVASQNLSIPLAIVNLSFGSGPVASLFLPFLGAYAIGSLPVNYGMMGFFRYCKPIHEPHHDGFDEEEEAELDKEFGIVSPGSESSNV